MKTGQSAVRRVAVVGAGVLLTATAFAGPALAQDTSSTSPTAACEQVVGELNDVVGQITDAQTALNVLQNLPTGTDPVGTDPVGTVTGGTSTLSGTSTDTSSGSTTSSTAEGSSADSGAPVVDGLVANKAFVTQAALTPAEQIQAQIADLQTRRGELASQFADLCSNLPSTGSQQGTASEVPLSSYTSAAPTSDSTDSNYYDDATGTPVYTTQVASVPTGGVNTGDGSYGP